MELRKQTNNTEDKMHSMMGLKLVRRQEASFKLLKQINTTDGKRHNILRVTMSQKQVKSAHRDSLGRFWQPPG